MRYRARVGDDAVEGEVDLESWPDVHAVVGDRPFDIRLTEVGPGNYWFVIEGRSVEAAVVRSGDGFSVRIGGDRFDVVLLDRRQSLRKPTSEQDQSRREVRAPMPGRVVQVLVEEGDAVGPRQGLLVLEAMKMQNEIKSLRQGTVRTLNVAEGMTVNAGDLLAIVE